MKKMILLFLCILTCTSMYAQKKDEAFYVFKEDWSAAKDYESAFYFMHVTKVNDSSYIGRTYTKSGPMVKWETFKDKETEIPHGRFAYYNSKGKIDSAGFVYEGKKDSSWTYKNAEGKFEREEKYNRGKLIKRISYAQKLITYPDGRTEPLPEEKTKAPFKEADSSVNTKDKKGIVIEVPAEYRGGIPAWLQYLQKNLKTPERLINLHKRESYYKAVVIALFDINIEGNVDNIFIEQSCEWSTDSEAIRVLTASSKWKPAMQNGRAVRYRHKQSLSFVVSQE